MNKTDLTPQFLAEKAWDLYQTHGVPFEVSEDILESHNLKLDQQLLDKLIHQHQELSKNTSTDQFKSGLLGNTSQTRKLHTTTHLLHQVLREMFGPEVKQKGSAITDEKARFDFTLDRRLEDGEIAQLEQKIQALIDKNLHMTKIETSEQEARKLGAIGLFGEKYGQTVTVYSLQDDSGNAFSREFCGGPHVDNTSEIGKFKILKQKSIGSGLKRLEFNVE